MASTVTNANLTVTISETINLGGQDINSENQVVIDNINEFSKRIVNVPSSTEIPIITFGTQPGAGMFVIDNVRYVRITNKDDTNPIRIRGASTSQVFDEKVEAGKSWMMGIPKISANNSGTAFSAFVSVYNIYAQADIAPVDVEFVVASL